MMSRAYTWKASGLVAVMAVIGVLVCIGVGGNMLELIGVLSVCKDLWAVQRQEQGDK